MPITHLLKHSFFHTHTCASTHTLLHTHYTHHIHTSFYIHAHVYAHMTHSHFHQATLSVEVQIFWTRQNPATLSVPPGMSADPLPALSWTGTIFLHRQEEQGKMGSVNVVSEGAHWSVWLVSWYILLAIVYRARPSFIHLCRTVADEGKF